jgi:hypothetical protein
MNMLAKSLFKCKPAWKGLTLVPNSNTSRVFLSPSWCMVGQYLEMDHYFFLSSHVTCYRQTCCT